MTKLALVPVEPSEDAPSELGCKFSGMSSCIRERDKGPEDALFALARAAVVYEQSLDDSALFDAVDHARTFPALAKLLAGKP